MEPEVMCLKLVHNKLKLSHSYEEMLLLFERWLDKDVI